MPYCPFCGSEVSEEDRFCQSCGAMLGSGSLSSAPPRRADRSRMIAVVFVVLILMSSIAGVLFYSAFELNNSEVSRTYKWGYEGHDFTYTLKVPLADYNSMMDSDIDRSGSISAERYTTASGTVVAVKDYIVVDSHISAMSDSFKIMYKEAFGSDPTSDDYVKFVTAFVQICIDYDYDEADNDREYWRYPLETLCDRTGDCEDTSILIAALIDAGGYNGGIILIPNHAMGAVCSDDLTGTYSNMRNSSVYSLDFYPIESTFNEFHTIGDLGDEPSSAYYHLYLGHATDYYVSS